MSSDYKLNVIDRDAIGSNSVKKIRRQGLVPTNFYFLGGANHNLAIDAKELWHALHSGSHLFVATIGKKSHHVQIKDIQYHPVSDEILHVDLMGFKMTDKISIAVAVVITGEAPGVKEGGVLMQNLNQIDIVCLPANVPDNIVIDISELLLGQHISVSDLTLSEDVEIVTSPETPIIAVQTPRIAVEEEVEELEVEIDEDEELAEEEEAPEQE